MNRATMVQVKHEQEIMTAVESWGDHEGMSHARVLGWLTQFDDMDLPLALKVMKHVKYYGAANIRGMTRQLFLMVRDELSIRKIKRIGFVPIGSAGSGSWPVARALRELVKGSAHKIINLLDIVRAKPGDYNIQAIVFIDDFSGTGTSFETWWNNVETIVRPLNKPVFVAVLVMNLKALEKLESLAQMTFSVAELGEGDNVLSNENMQFSSEEQAALLDACYKTKCEQAYLKGFGECGLLLAFRHGCPNNSLPILWHDSDSWRSLFTRRAL